MRFLSCVCLGVLAFSAFADESSPEVYSDISKRAQQNAVKYDGFKLLGGLTYSISSFSAGVKNGWSFTENSIKNAMLMLGVEYSKKVKKRFLLGAKFLVDLGKSQKKSKNWKDLNYEYYDREGANYRDLNSLTGEIKTPCCTPEIALKGGYIFRNLGTVAYLKLGAQYLKVKYIYSGDGREVCSYNAIKFVPLIGVGGYKRINKRFGVDFEINFPFKRNFEKTKGNLCHKVKMGRKSLRVMATYSIPGKFN